MYLIEILHQTTTKKLRNETFPRCILSKFYIKPQQHYLSDYRCRSCILSKFYIKPQRSTNPVCSDVVVSYRNSTSNHNYVHTIRKIGKVVSYRNSTSNHNIISTFSTHSRVVSYRNSTSNHNCPPGYVIAGLLYLIEILHQTTTINAALASQKSCILSKFYIKPQRWVHVSCKENSCILSKFYIKPQPSTRMLDARCGCILSKFYIKPQRNHG